MPQLGSYILLIFKISSLFYIFFATFPGGISKRLYALKNRGNIELEAWMLQNHVYLRFSCFTLCGERVILRITKIVSFLALKSNVPCIFLMKNTKFEENAQNSRNWERRHFYVFFFIEKLVCLPGRRNIAFFCLSFTLSPNIAF